MRRLLIAVISVMILPACGGERIETTVGIGLDGGMYAPPPTQALIQATNYDYYDYALWLEWQDDAGYWNTTYLFTIYGDSSVGPTVNYQIILANPSIPYTVLLADPDGTLYDSYTLWLPAGSVADVRFDVFDGYLYRTY